MCRIRRALRHSWAQKSTAESMCSAKSTLAALVLVAPAAAYVSVTPAAHATAHHRPMAMRPRFQNPQLQLDVLAAVDTFYQTSPIQAAFLTCGVKASLSDTISQRSVEMVCSKTGKVTAHRFCFSRNGAFILYGALYQGVTQHLIYNDIYPVIFGTGTDAGTVAAKVVFDQLVHAPLLALPVAYLVKAAVFKYPLAEGLQRYAADAQRDLLWKYWLLWSVAVAGSLDGSLARAASATPNATGWSYHRRAPIAGRGSASLSWRLSEAARSAGAIEGCAPARSLPRAAAAAHRPKGG